MKTSRNRCKLIFFIALFAYIGTKSCTDLTEETFNILEAGVFYRDKTSVLSVIGGLYTKNDNNEQYFGEVNEWAADQFCWRTWNAGAWGWDEGLRYYLSTHSWTPLHNKIKDVWSNGFNIIGLCNSALEDFRSLDLEKVKVTKAEMDEFIAEVRTLRAWAYYRMFEVFGGTLPICTTLDATSLPEPPSKDFKEGCRLIYDFIMTELDEALDDLPQNVTNRMNQAVNRMIKARLFLNAKIFIDEDRFTECELLSQDILNGSYGKYSLAPDYRSIRTLGNQSCPEVIYATARQTNYYTNTWVTGTTLHSSIRNQYFSPNKLRPYGVVSNNCTGFTPSKDNSGDLMLGEKAKSFLFDYGDKLGATLDRMHEKDTRKQNYVYNSATGEWHGMILQGLMRENFGKGSIILGDADRKDQALVFVDQVGTFQNLGRNLEVVMSPRWGETNSLVRIMDYPIYPQETGLYFADADNVQFRLAEVYFNLAECKLRKGDAGGAKDIVSQVRQRYFTGDDWITARDEYPGFTAIDLDWMLSEWGLEFLNEGQRRRTDLRRFDKFTQGQWWFFGRATDEYGAIFPAKRDRKYEWYPVPDVALTANPKLVQNPDYL